MDDDKSLGMDRAIDRRDFLNGVAVGIGALGVGGAARALAEAAAVPWPQDVAGYYPPVLTGMRGSHPGSFENAHKLARRRLLDRGQRRPRTPARPTT